MSNDASRRAEGAHDSIPVEIGTEGLQALLGLPANARGVVIFAHGSGSSRFSPRNNHVAAELRKRRFATLLLDLLTPREEQDRRNVFDVALLAQRLAAASEWASEDARTRALSIGYFGASTGAAAALIAGAFPDARVRAIVSRGGRPDLAGATLADVRAPTLLIVGDQDVGVVELNQSAFAHLTAPKELVLVKGSGHLFEEPGALDAVVQHAARWFDAYL